MSATVIFPQAAFAEVLSNNAAATAPTALVVNLIFKKLFNVTLEMGITAVALHTD